MGFLFDTYAFIAYYVDGSRAYEPYFKNISGPDSTTILSILELYHKVYHEVGEEHAEELLQSILGNFRVYGLRDVGVVKRAGQLRSRMLKEGKKPSYTDCVNYVTAQSLRLKFLTGDEAFKNEKEVEYVK